MTNTGTFKQSNWIVKGLKGALATIVAGAIMYLASFIMRTDRFQAQTAKDIEILYRLVKERARDSSRHKTTDEVNRELLRILLRAQAVRNEPLDIRQPVPEATHVPPGPVKSEIRNDDYMRMQRQAK